nr:Calcineurin-like metallo-phosphoesterase superfamily protein, putative [Ipomoea batatas]
MFTQVALCFALYVVLNTGQFQRSLYGDNDSADTYFISVSGGFRPLQEQIHLLKQMEMVAKKNRAKFVINISELGEGDPLMQNVRRLMQLSLACRYTVQALKGQGGNYYLKHIEVTHGRTLDLIAIDTTLYQVLFLLCILLYIC